MTTDRIERAARAVHPSFDRETPALQAVIIEAMTKHAKALFPEIFSDPPTAWVAPWEPTKAMWRSLLVDMGYDPDVKSETLDTLGELDIATLKPSVTRKWRTMRDAHLKESA